MRPGDDHPAGRTVETGTLSELRHLTRTSIIADTVKAPVGLDALEGIHDLRVENHRARFDVDTDRLDETMRQLVGLGIRSLVSRPPTLEELFLRHYGDELAADGVTGDTSTDADADADAAAVDEEVGS